MRCGHRNLAVGMTAFPQLRARVTLPPRIASRPVREEASGPSRMARSAAGTWPAHSDSNFRTQSDAVTRRRHHVASLLDRKPASTGIAWPVT